METLTVPATLDSLKRIRDFVMLAAKAAGLGKRTTYRLQLGVDEIASNTIKYGYAETETEEILHISADINDQNLTIILEDRGTPYDPHQTPLLDDFNLPLEKRRMGGLGIYLTLRGIDEVLYERAGEWNRIRFVMKR